MVFIIINLMRDGLIIDFEYLFMGDIDTMRIIRNEILQRVTWKELILVLTFVIITIAGFIYSPWEKDSTFVLERILDNGKAANDIIQNFFFKLFFYGILDWVEMMAYGMYEIVAMGDVYTGDWGLLGFAAIDICLIAFLIFKVLVNYIEEEFWDEDVNWKMCIKRYMFESAITYVFCLVLHSFINYGIMKAVYWLYEKHQLIAAFLSCIFVLFGFWMIISVYTLMMSYVIVIIIPILIWILLTIIPGIGILFNSILGVIVFIFFEIYMIFYVWNKVFTDKALSLSVRVALFPARFVYDRFL